MIEVRNETTEVSEDQYSKYLHAIGMTNLHSGSELLRMEPRRDVSYPIGFVLDDRKVNAFMG